MEEAGDSSVWSASWIILNIDLDFICINYFHGTGLWVSPFWISKIVNIRSFMTTIACSILIGEKALRPHFRFQAHGRY